MILNLLIVEDDVNILKQWEEKLEIYNVDDGKPYTIRPKFYKNMGDALSNINLSTFNAAIIDIRLQDDSGAMHQNNDGNKIIEELSRKSLTVTAVYTGEPKIVELNEYQKDFVKIFLKGNGDIDSIIEWLDEKSPMIEAIHAMQESIKETMASAFTKSIWPRWTYWVNGSDAKDTNSALTRHMATHLHASFLNMGDSGAHPEEYFFIPPLQEKLNTGDIIYIEGSFEIIITPRCDMARSNSTSTYQLIKLENQQEQWNLLEAELNYAKEINSEKKMNSARNNILKFTNHSGKNGCHFIQQFRAKIDEQENKYGPFYAQFNCLRSIERTEDNESLLKSHRIASLSNEFIPSLVERLGSYFSRIGTPDYSHPE